MADNPFEIPQQMRDLTEQNLKQAHAAYELRGFHDKIHEGLDDRDARQPRGRRLQRSPIPRRGNGEEANRPPPSA